MSRFENLEFDGASEGEFREETPSLDEVHYLGEGRRAYEQLEFERSLRACAKALEFNPNNTAAWAGQVRALIELGEFREAKLWADKALERFPQHAELLAAKAVALGRSGDLDAALAFSDASVEERGDTPYIWLARADVLLARQESRADYCFAKALGLAPGDWFVAWLAARIRFYYQQFLAAMKLLQQAIEWNATHFVLWLELGQCQLALGQSGAAQRSFGRARELNPDCAAARLAEARASSAGLSERMAGFWRRLFRG